MRAAKRVVGVALLALVFGLGLWWQGGLAPPPPPRASYTVVKGDTLSRIARDHGVTVAALQQWNDLASDRIAVGAVLWVAPPSGANVPAIAAKEARPSRGHRAAGDPPRTAATPPAERPCRAGPSLADGSDGPSFAASEGLSSDEVRGVMNGAQSRFSACITDEWPDGSVHLTMTVACSGRVARVVPSRVVGLSDDLVDCVLRVLQETTFPPHALPDGETIEYPLTFSR